MGEYPAVPFIILVFILLSIGSCTVGMSIAGNIDESHDTRLRAKTVACMVKTQDATYCQEP